MKNQLFILLLAIGTFRLFSHSNVLGTTPNILKNQDIGDLNDGKTYLVTLYKGDQKDLHSASKILSFGFTCLSPNRYQLVIVFFNLDQGTKEYEFLKNYIIQRVGDVIEKEYVIGPIHTMEIILTNTMEEFLKGQTEYFVVHELQNILYGCTSHSFMGAKISPLEVKKSAKIKK